ncbi:MAG: DNA/RNA nuclease SfsA [Leptospirales bacterium]
MFYSSPLIRALFLKREKRYSVLARLENGEEVWAHTPNPGRLLSCLEVQGTPIFLSRVPEREKNGPKYRFRVEQSEPIPGVRVGINPILANTLTAEILAGSLHPALSGATVLGREVVYGEASRVDFLLEREGRRMFLEVKSVTYRDGHAGLFPDAVSSRAVRHLGELENCIRSGDLAVIFFVVQRGDVSYVAPADKIDPAYGESFRRAMGKNVLSLAMRVKADSTGLFPDIPLEVRCDHS